MIDTQFLDWFNATVVVESAIGSSSGGYGGRKFAAGSSALARIEQYITKVVSNGQNLDTQARIFVAPFDTSGTSSSVTVTPRDRITIPSGYIIGASMQPRILSAEQLNDEYGFPALYEVMI